MTTRSDGKLNASNINEYDEDVLRRRVAELRGVDKLRERDKRRARVAAQIAALPPRWHLTDSRSRRSGATLSPQVEVTNVDGTGKGQGR